MFDIVGFGEPLFEFAQLPDEPGKYLLGFGGDVMNAIVAASRLGANTALISALGDDPFGNSILQMLAVEGVDTKHVALSKTAPTGGYFVHFTEQGHAFSYARRESAASRIAPFSVPAVPIQNSKWFHTSGISLAISGASKHSTIAAMKIAHDAGVKLSFDLNFRPRLWRPADAREIIEPLLAEVDLFLPSIDEAELVFGLKGAEQVIAHSHTCGAKTVALKCGKDGAIISDGSRVEKIPGHMVEEVDATGAGDCFAGALLTRLCLGDELLAAARYACIAAAISTTSRGAIAGMPDVHRVRARTEAGENPRR